MKYRGRPAISHYAWINERGYNITPHYRTLKFKVIRVDKINGADETIPLNHPDVKVLYYPEYKRTEEDYINDEKTNHLSSYAFMFTIYLTTGHPQQFSYLKWHQDFERFGKNRIGLFAGVTPNFFIGHYFITKRIGKVTYDKILSNKDLYGNGFIKDGKTHILFFHKKKLVNYLILDGEIHYDWYETLKVNNRLIT
jgi:hypothetical protein